MMMGMKDDLFAVIADPTRRHILEFLAIERLSVGELVEELGISQPTVSKHLKVLRTAGLVETEAVGQKRFYSLVPQPLERVTDWLTSLVPPLSAAQHDVQRPPLPAAGEQSVEPEDSLNKPAESVEEKDSPENSVQPQLTEQAVEQAEVKEPAETAEPAEVLESVEADVPESADLDASRPQGSQPSSPAITFTPFTPFTPSTTADARPTSPLAAETKTVSAASEDPQELLSVDPVEVSAPAEIEDQDVAQRQEHTPPLYAEDKLAVPQDDTDERGLFAKLTRLRRRAR
ncbi:metalloregulator ArsR/SmtB family transcription factor [Rothia sp. (in: high G+C Gram-positive bacteria)]|uniref:metalloregulator ArsR/SmtB family transcription factor n=1 Tax=Rothia sp. (in: high G+C Gram-positive bacteria) TaxID=1885016 RepID=UPI003217F42A